MAIVARRDTLLHWAINHGVRPNASALAQAAGLHERTMRRVLAGHAVSGVTFGALLVLTGPDVARLFEMRGTHVSPGSGRQA